MLLSHTASKPFREAKNYDQKSSPRHWGYYTNVDKALRTLPLFTWCLAYGVLITGSGDRTDLYISLSTLYGDIAYDAPVIYMSGKVDDHASDRNPLEPY